MDVLTLFFIKLVITVTFVLILSLIAEFVSPRLSGIISGVPTGTAIILFFYGIEQGADFAIKSSYFNLAGMFAMYVFIFLYFRFSNDDSVATIIKSSFIAILGYFLSILILKQLNLNLFGAILIPSISIILFSYLFKNIKESKIKKRAKLSIKLLIFRTLIASSAIMLITMIAGFVGPEWAGLFSVFPTTLFPLIIIIHSTYGHEKAHAIIKNVPKGSLAIIIYILGISFFYQKIGVILGTLLSYAGVILYLVILFALEKLRDPAKS